ncbi:hypothetical protein F511_40721 [Dorcoceras hygrometricum]|uniref:Uncharacterized protein n=1 Tax=Dorcoceras hygrometricum TaxID=472368 RepID=A0A2Z7B790_9LAMI|nr:hypothetical protein F511_40721 [Dorcoceras hygrometricum]
MSTRPDTKRIRGNPHYRSRGRICTQGVLDMSRLRQARKEQCELDENTVTAINNKSRAQAERHANKERLRSTKPKKSTRISEVLCEPKCKNQRTHNTISGKTFVKQARLEHFAASFLVWSRHEDIQTGTVRGRLSWTSRRYRDGREQHEDQTHRNAMKCRIVEAQIKCVQVWCSSAERSCFNERLNEFEVTPAIGAEEESVRKGYSICLDWAKRVRNDASLMITLQQLNIHPEEL